MFSCTIWPTVRDHAGCLSHVTKTVTETKNKYSMKITASGREVSVRSFGHSLQQTLMIRMNDHRNERTFAAVKPDGVQRGLVGEIVKCFEARGYKLVAGKLVWVS